MANPDNIHYYLFILIIIVHVLFIALIIKNFIKSLSLIQEKYDTLRIKVFNWLGRILLKLANILSDKSSIDDQYHPLTPNSNSKEITVYIGALESAIRSTEVKNIALTGPYGSGKSSILKTFQYLHPELNFLNISLASFKEDTVTDYQSDTSDKAIVPMKRGSKDGVIKIKRSKEADKADSQKTVLLSQSIEYSILQQIFYHVTHQEIPFSRFKRIRNLKWYLLLSYSLFYVAWICSVCWILWSEKIAKSLPNDLSKALIDDLNKLYVISFLIAGAIFIVYQGFSSYYGSRFSKVNLPKGELEISTDHTDSVLNKHIDELIYFFEVTGFNTVIVEDLDRFKNPKIFIKLREINGLINNSRQVKQKVVFIYALGDDVFVDEGRTKFFDFIIPVIPIINTSNSREMLVRRIERLALDQEIPLEFISDISEYITDMRLLLNIVNEFLVYKNQLRDFQFPYVNLLALIIYKNKDPHDFTELHYCRGKAYSLLKNRTKFIDTAIQKLEKRKLELEKDIEVGSSTFLNDVRELKTVYVSRIFEELQTNSFDGSLFIGAERVFFNDIIDSQFENFTKQTKLYYSSAGSKMALGYGFEHIEQKVNKEKPYKIRLEEVNLRQKYNNDLLQNELLKVNNEISNIKSYSIQELLEKYSLDDLTTEYEKDGLLKYLVIYGYLNDDYHYYLSNFIEGSLSKVEMDFFFAVKENRNYPFEYGLPKAEELVSRLRIKDFKNSQVLNNDILDHLLSDSEKYHEQIDNIALQISKSEGITSQFLKQYLRLGKNLPTFIDQISKRWERFWEFIELDAEIVEEEKRRLFFVFLNTCSIKSLIAQNHSLLLSKFILASPDFISIAKQNLTSDRIIHIIKGLDIKFETLPSMEKDDSVFEHIYSNDQYKLSVDNTKRVLENILTPENFDEQLFSTSHLTYIKSTSAEYLIDYIFRELEAYVEHVVIPLESSTDESQETVLEVLSNDISHDLQAKFISNQNIRITDIEEVRQELWPMLFSLNRVAPSWENVIIAYKTLGISNEMVGYLNLPFNYNALKELSLDTVKDYPQSISENFIDALCLRSDIDLTALDNLLTSPVFYLAGSDLTRFSKEILKVQVKQNMFPYNPTIYDYLKGNDKALWLRYLYFQEDKFFEDLPELSLDDYITILNEVTFVEANDKKLIEAIDDSHYNHPRMADAIIKNIVEMEDFSWISNDLINSLMRYSSLNEEKKKILVKRHDYIQPDTIYELLKYLGDKFEKIGNHKRPKIDNTPSNLQLLQTIQGKGLIISNLDIEPKRIQVYTKRR